MRDMHERSSDIVLDPLEFDLHLSTQLEIKSTEWLIEEQYVGFVYQCASQGHSLLLAAGQLAGLASSQRRKLDELEHGLDGRSDILDLATPKPESDVFEDVQMREQCIRLEDGVDRTLECPQRRHITRADVNGAAGRVFQPRDHAQGGCLAAARGTQKCEEGTRRDREIEMIDRDRVTKLLCQPTQMKIFYLATRHHVLRLVADSGLEVLLVLQLLFRRELHEYEGLVQGVCIGENPWIIDERRID